MKWNGKGENENKWNEIEYEWMERNFMGIRDELDEINGIWSNEMRINEDGNMNEWNVIFGNQRWIGWNKWNMVKWSENKWNVLKWGPEIAMK